MPALRSSLKPFVKRRPQTLRELNARMLEQRRKAITTKAPRIPDKQMLPIIQLHTLLKKENYKKVAEILESGNLPEDLKRIANNKLRNILVYKLKHGRLNEVLGSVLARDCPKLLVTIVRQILVNPALKEELNSHYKKRVIRLRVEQLDKILGRETPKPKATEPDKREKTESEKYLEVLRQRQREAAEILAAIPKAPEYKAPEPKPQPARAPVPKPTPAPEPKPLVATRKPEPAKPEAAKVETRQIEPEAKRLELAKETTEQLKHRFEVRRKTIIDLINNFNLHNAKDLEIKHPEDIDALARHISDIEIQTSGMIDVEKMLKRGVGQRLALMLNTHKSLLMPLERYIVRDARFTICPVVEPTNANRLYCVIYVTKNKETKQTVVYKSGSSTDWRILPLRGGLGEGDLFHNKLESELSLTLPAEIQRKLDVIKPVKTSESKTIIELAPLLREIIPETQEDIIGIQERMKKTIYKDATTERPILDISDTSNLPNLENPKYIASIWKTESSIYNSFSRVCIYSKNKKFIWVFAVTKEGSFLSNVQVANGKISQYGLVETPKIKDDLALLLETPIREYPGQLRNRLTRRAKNARQIGNLKLAETIENILARYKDLEGDKPIGEYVNVINVLMQHPLFASFQKPLQEIARRYKTEPPKRQEQVAQQRPAIAQRPTAGKPEPSVKVPPVIGDLFAPPLGEKEVHVDDEGRVLAGPKAEHGRAPPIVAGQAPQNLPQSFKAMGYDFNYAGIVNVGKYNIKHHRYVANEGLDVLVSFKGRRPLTVRSATRTYSPKYGEIDLAFRKAIKNLNPAVPPVQREERTAQTGRQEKERTRIREQELGDNVEPPPIPEDAKRRPPVIEEGETELEQRRNQEELPNVSVEPTKKIEKELLDYKTKKSKEIKRKYGQEYSDLFLKILNREIEEEIKTGEGVNTDIVEREFADKVQIVERIQEYEAPFGVERKEAFEFANNSERVRYLENGLTCNLENNRVSFFKEGLAKPISFSTGGSTLYVITNKTICKYPDGIFKRLKSTEDLKYNESDTTSERILGVAVYSAKEKRVKLYAVQIEKGKPEPTKPKTPDSEPPKPPKGEGPRPEPAKVTDPKKKFLKEIEPIQKQEFELIRNKVDLRTVVEEPLLPAAELFYDLNIETVTSSANKQSGKGFDAYLGLNVKTLSSENLAVAKRLGGLIDLSSHGSGKIMFNIPVTGNETVEEISNRFLAIAKQFKKQELSKPKEADATSDFVKDAVETQSKERKLTAGQKDYNFCNYDIPRLIKGPTKDLVAARKLADEITSGFYGSKAYRDIAEVSGDLMDLEKAKIFAEKLNLSEEWYTRELILKKIKKLQKEIEERKLTKEGKTVPAKQTMTETERIKFFEQVRKSDIRKRHDLDKVKSFLDNCVEVDNLRNGIFLDLYPTTTGDKEVRFSIKNIDTQYFSTKKNTIFVITRDSIDTYQRDFIGNKYYFRNAEVYDPEEHNAFRMKTSDPGVLNMALFNDPIIGIAFFDAKTKKVTLFGQPEEKMEKSALEEQQSPADLPEDDKEEKRKAESIKETNKYTAAQDLRKKGDIDGAIAMANSISDPYWRGESLYEATATLVKTGDLVKAKKLVDQTLIGKDSNYELGSYAYCMFAQTSRDPAFLDKAQELAEKLPPELIPKKKSLTEAIEKIRKAIEESPKAKTPSEINEQRDKNNAIYDTMKDLIKKADLKGAQKAVEGITNIYLKNSGYLDIVRSFVRNGNLDSARAVIIDRMTLNSDRVSACCEIARVSKNKFDLEKAREFADKSEGTEVSKANAYCEIADVSRDLTDLEKAKTFAKLITVEDIKKDRLEKIEQLRKEIEAKPSATAKPTPPKEREFYFPEPYTFNFLRSTQIDGKEYWLYDDPTGKFRFFTEPEPGGKVAFVESERITGQLEEPLTKESWALFQDAFLKAKGKAKSPEGPKAEAKREEAPKSTPKAGTPPLTVEQVGYTTIEKLPLLKEGSERRILFCDSLENANDILADKKHPGAYLFEEAEKAARFMKNMTAPFCLVYDVPKHDVFKQEYLVGIVSSKQGESTSPKPARSEEPAKRGDAQAGNLSQRLAREIRKLKGEDTTPKNDSPEEIERTSARYSRYLMATIGMDDPQIRAEILQKDGAKEINRYIDEELENSSKELRDKVDPPGASEPTLKKPEPEVKAPERAVTKPADSREEKDKREGELRSKALDLVRNGDLEEARKLVEEIDNRFMKGTVYLEIVNGYVAKGNLDVARKLITENISEVDKKAEACYLVARTSKDKTDLENARKYLDLPEATNAGIARGYFWIAQISRDLADLTKAKTAAEKLTFSKEGVLAEIEKLRKEIEETPAKTPKELAAQFAQNVGELRTALGPTDKSGKFYVDLIMDHKTQKERLAEIRKLTDVEILENIDRIAHIVQEAEYKELETAAKGRLADLSREERKPATAEETKALEPAKPKDEIEEILKTGDIEKAKARAKEITDDYKRSLAHVKIIKSLAAKGNFESARKYIDETITKNYWKSIAYVEIANISEKNQDFESAIKCAKKITSDSIDYISNLIFTAAIEKGNVAIAERCLAEITAEKDKAKYSAMLTKLKEKKKTNSTTEKAGAKPAEVRKLTPEQRRETLDRFAKQLTDAKGNITEANNLMLIKYNTNPEIAKLGLEFLEQHALEVQKTLLPFCYWGEKVKDGDQHISFELTKQATELLSNAKLTPQEKEQLKSKIDWNKLAKFSDVGPTVLNYIKALVAHGIEIPEEHYDYIKRFADQFKVSGI